MFTRHCKERLRELEQPVIQAPPAAEAEWLGEEEWFRKRHEALSDPNSVTRTTRGVIGGKAGAFRSLLGDGVGPSIGDRIAAIKQDFFPTQLEDKAGE